MTTKHLTTKAEPFFEKETKLGNYLDCGPFRKLEDVGWSGSAALDTDKVSKEV